MHSEGGLWWFLQVLGVAACLVVAGCQRQHKNECDLESPSPDSQGSLASVRPLATQMPQSPEEIQSIWEEGSRADTYVVNEAGMNSSCARCHAPLNWVPVAEELPESLAESATEISTTVSLIDELEWTNVGCRVCHNDAEEQISGEIAWLEVALLGSTVK